MNDQLEMLLEIRDQINRLIGSPVRWADLMNKSLPISTTDQLTLAEAREIIKRLADKVAGK